MALNVSIIIPLHNPDQKILKHILKKLQSQSYEGKIEIIKMEEGLGLAAALNSGIQKSKYDIIISFHQDCVPASNNWLKKLVEPLKQKEIIATVSKVELPFKFWTKFGFFARVMSIKEQKILTFFFR